MVTRVQIAPSTSCPSRLLCYSSLCRERMQPAGPNQTSHDLPVAFNHFLASPPETLHDNSFGKPIPLSFDAVTWSVVVFQVADVSELGTS